MNFKFIIYQELKHYFTNEASKIGSNYPQGMPEGQWASNAITGIYAQVLIDNIGELLPLFYSVCEG